MSREPMPSRAALSLSTVTITSTPFSCWSVSMSVKAGCRFIWSASRSAQTRRSAALSLLSVYWLVELLCRPPPRKSCTGFRNSCTPVTCAICGRSRLMTAWPDSLRSPSGFRFTKTKPPPARPPPVKPTTVSTAGSLRMMSTSWRSFSCSAWNEIARSARRPPLIWPVS